MATEVKGLVLRIATRLDDIDARLREAEGKMKQSGQRMSGAASEIQGAITRAFAVGAVAALGKQVVETAIAFEASFAGVRKTVNATEAQFQALEEGIRGMARELPASAVEIAGVAEAAGQLGIETDNILGFSRVMIDLGETTNLSADQAATALARLANITGLPQDQFDRLGSTIVDLGNNLATTEAEIVSMGLRLAGAGEQIGLTEAQILGMAGALSSVGIEAEAGGSAFSKVMIDIANAAATGSKDLDAFAEVAGMSASQFKQAFETDAAGAFASFVEGLKRIEAEGGNTLVALKDLGIEEVRMRDALLRTANAGDLLRKSMDLGTKAFKENTALVKEAEQRYQTTEAQLKTFTNQLTDIGITLGSVVLPGLVKTTQAATDFFDVIRAAGDKDFPGLLQMLNKYAKSLEDIGVLNNMAYGSLLNITGILSIFASDTEKAAGSTEILIDKVGDVDGVTQGWIDTLTKGNKEVEKTPQVLKPTVEQLEKAAKEAEEFDKKLREANASLPAFAKNIRGIEEPIGKAAAKLKLIEENIRASEESMEDFILAFSNASAAMTPPLREVQVEMDAVEKGAEEMGEALEQSFGQRQHAALQKFANVLESDIGGAMQSAFGSLAGGDILGTIQALAPAMGPFGTVLGAAIPLVSEIFRGFDKTARKIEEMNRQLRESILLFEGFIEGFSISQGAGGGSGFGIDWSWLDNLNLAPFQDFAEVLAEQVGLALQSVQDAIDNAGIGRERSAFATEADVIRTKIEIMREALARLAVEGYGPNSAAVQEYEARLKELQAQLADMNARDVLKGLREEMERIDALAQEAASTGADFDEAAERMRALRDAMADLVLNGIDPSHPAYQRLLEQYMALAAMAEDAGRGTREFVDGIREIGGASEEAGPSVVDLGDSFGEVEDAAEDAADAARHFSDEIAPWNDILDDLARRQNRVNAEFAQYGNETDRARDMIRALNEAMIQMRIEGFEGTDAFAALADQLAEWQQVLKDLEQSAKDAADATRDQAGANEEVAEGGGSGSGSGSGGGGSTTIEGDVTINIPREIDVVVQDIRRTVDVILDNFQFGAMRNTAKYAKDILLLLESANLEIGAGGGGTGGGGSGGGSGGGGTTTIINNLDGNTISKVTWRGHQDIVTLEQGPVV